MYLPRTVTDVAAKRVENEVVLQFKVPAANTDSTSPADLDRVDVYAHTGPLPKTDDFLKYGTLVQSIKIKQPVVKKPEDEKKQQGAEPGAAGAAGALGAAGPAAPKQVVEATAEASATPYRPELAPDVAGTANVAADPEAGMIEQGWATSVHEALTEKLMELGPMPPTRPVPQPVTPVQVETLETPGTVNFPLPPARYYTIVGVSRSRHRRGPFAGPIRVPLVTPLQPPDKIDTTYTESSISLVWPAQPEDMPLPASTTVAVAGPGSSQTPPAETPATVADVEPLGDPNQETPGTHEIYVDVETEGTEDAARPGAAPTPKPQPPPTPRFGYNVYDASTLAPNAPSAPDAPSAPAAPAAPVVPLNATLLTAPLFSDPRVEFGTERCYVVRRVEMTGTIAIESAASPPACITPVDKFPPAAPKALTSVASGTAVSLIWDANTEADLGGYLVLRGEAPGDKLAPLTPAPISDASYVDSSVRRNRTYVYEVVAVDKTGNQSVPSNRVEEPIR